MNTFKLYGRTFIYGKVGELDVYDVIINKDNILFYRIYKMKTKSETKMGFVYKTKGSSL